MVSAWATENALVLGQFKTEEKSKEITAIPELLELLELEGCLITIDAMRSQKSFVKKITEKNGNYVIALEGNQGHLHDEVMDFCQTAHETNFEELTWDKYETDEQNHGWYEFRRY